MTEAQVRATRDHFKALMALPVDNPERPKLRDRVPLSTSKLAARALKLCTLKPASFWGSTARKLTEPEPPYRARLWALTGHLFTRQSPVVLNIPREWKDTADYVAQFDSLNNHKE